MPSVKGKGNGGLRQGAGRKPILQGSDVIVLRTPLPCSIRKGDGVCGNPATVAHAWAQDSQSMLWPTPGLWTVQPVCKECAKVALSRQSV